MTAASAAAAESFGDTYLYAIAEVLQGEERIGLGFFLAKHIIATCSHVVHDAGADLRVRIPGGTREVRLVFEDATRDVAFLQLDAPITGYRVRPLEVDHAPPQGAPVQLVGWPVRGDGPLEQGTALLHASRIEGVVSVELPRTGTRADVYRLGSDVRPGYSGGPVVLEGTWRACGMVVAREEHERTALVVPGFVVAESYRHLVAKTGSERVEPAIPTGAARLPLPPPPGGRYRRDDHVARSTLDAHVLRLFADGAPIVLCAPTMSGKTWWLNHFLPSFQAALGPNGRIISPSSSLFSAQ